MSTSNFIPPMQHTVTRKNLEAAFGGESMAYQKYLFFARVARELGNEEVAKLFEDTARQETAHAYGHLDLLYPRETLTIEKILAYAIEGETYEFTTMYPGFRQKAEEEQDDKAVAEFLEQEGESREHAEIFKEALKKAEKRFAALAKVEQRHAGHYSAMRDKQAQ